MSQFQEPENKRLWGTSFIERSLNASVMSNYCKILPQQGRTTCTPMNMSPLEYHLKQATEIESGSNFLLHITLGKDCRFFFFNLSFSNGSGKIPMKSFDSRDRFLLM